MKKRWIRGLLLVTAVLLGGCGKTPRTEASKPLASPEELEEEEPQVVIESELSSFEFSIEGVTYRLPVTVQELTNQGWVYQGEDTEPVPGKSYLESREFHREKEVLIADVTNFSPEEQPVSCCYIGRVVLHPNDDDPTVTLPGNIVMGTSTIVQVMELYGTPKDRYEDELQITLTYEYGIYRKAVLTFDEDTEVLIAAELCNQTDPADRELFATVKNEETEEVRQYREPQLLTTELMDFIVEYGGDLYQIPAPVKTFLDNGWELNQESSDAYVKSGEFGYATLQKDGQQLYAVVTNCGSEATVTTNCFITSVSGDLTVTKVPICIARGICLGMSEKDFLDAVEGLEWETQQDKEAGTVTYLFYKDEEKLDQTAVIIDEALSLVSGIRVTHYQEGQENRQQIIQAMEMMEGSQKGI